MNRDVLRRDLRRFVYIIYSRTGDGGNVAVKPWLCIRSYLIRNTLSIGLANEIQAGAEVNIKVDGARRRVGANNINFSVHINRIAFSNKDSAGERGGIIFTRRIDRHGVRIAPYNSSYVGHVRTECRAHLPPADA